MLPGVSVEASSDVLIERTRSVVTDDQGGHSIVDLRPGVYKVVFTLQGFSKLQRDGIELPSNFNASVNVEMSVGALEETVTVSGASPIVDVQSSQKTVNLGARCSTRYQRRGPTPPKDRWQWASRSWRRTSGGRGLPRSSGSTSTGRPPPTTPCRSTGCR